MRVLFATSELHPLAKSGGLADVSRGLPAALHALGLDVRIVLPAYPQAKADLQDARIEAPLPQILGIENGIVLSGRAPGLSVPVWMVDAPSLFDRVGGLYQDENGRDWVDNAERFAYFAHAASHLARGLGGWVPDVVHANDWHAGLLPLLLSLQSGSRPATVFTIHNLAFQGNFPKEMLFRVGVPERLFSADGIEFYGQLSFMKAAIQFSDRITTVSPTYADEILTPEFGCGMEGILRQRADVLSGILNGIDTDEWNPGRDDHLPNPYGLHNLSGKNLCKGAVQEELGLDKGLAGPLIGFCSRVTHQKMADIVAEALPALVEAGAQFALLGEGDPALEAALAVAGRQYPGRAAIHLDFDESAAHRLQAGADILLAPARFEPCGLTQLHALRYGTLPVVRRTGGLADTITDTTPETLSSREATGFCFEEPNQEGLLDAAFRAMDLYREPPVWRRLQRQAMAQDFGWATSSAKYASLYRVAAGLPAQMEIELPSVPTSNAANCANSVSPLALPSDQR